MKSPIRATKVRRRFAGPVDADGLNIERLERAEKEDIATPAVNRRSAEIKILNQRVLAYEGYLQYLCFTLTSVADLTRATYCKSSFGKYRV